MKNISLYPATRIKKNDQTIRINNFHTLENPLEYQLYDKISKAYNIGRSLNFNYMFDKCINHHIPRKLNEVFVLNGVYDKEVYHERGASFIPMGTAFCAATAIELNTFYLSRLKNNQFCWFRIFWHEFSHLIDTNNISEQLIGDMLKKNYQRYKLLKPTGTFKLIKILPYFYKPLRKKTGLHFKRLIREVFAESMAIIMLLVCHGIYSKNITILRRLKGFFFIYEEILIHLIKDIQFREIGLNISLKKRQTLIHLIQQISQEEYRLYHR